MTIDTANVRQGVTKTTEFCWTRQPAPALDTAYGYCRELTAQHSRSFSLAARLLSADDRPAIWSLYAFCRTVDDAVDQPTAHVTSALNTWRQVSTGNNPIPHDPIAVAWNHTLNHRAIPRRYALELIDGVERDLTQTRYRSFADLCTYCYGVASTVGLMSMHIIGFSGPEAIPYAVKLGIALQMTNILRDVGEDWERGRLYLPSEELARFDLSERDIEYGHITDRWRQFMDFQISRTRRLYDQAWTGISLLNGTGQLAIGAAASFYRGILDEIERNDYDVFNQRASVSTWGKIRQLPGLWWQTRTASGLIQ